MPWHNPNKTSPLDSFYSKFGEVIRIFGCRYSTVYDFLVVCNIRLLMEHQEMTRKVLSELTGIGISTIKGGIELKSRFTGGQIYKISRALGVKLSELYVDRAEFMGESPTFRF